VRITGIDGSPRGSGRTERVIRAVLAAASSEEAGVQTSLLSLASRGSEAVEAVVNGDANGDAFVIGSPIYRASYTGTLKAFFDALPRGMWGEVGEPLRAKPVVIVATGASFHHFLALDDLRNVLSSFFAAFVLPPGLYVPHEGFGADDHADDQLTPEYAQLASTMGSALAEQANVLARSRHLARLRPQA
jgi:FMN reductase